jgi:hypothetical protein
MQTAQRQRTIRRILSDGLRSKVYAKIGHVFSHDIKLHVDFETVNHGIFIKGLKDHLRLVCEWLEWIETARQGIPCIVPEAVKHAIRQTRNVSVGNSCIIPNP